MCVSGFLIGSHFAPGLISNLWQKTTVTNWLEQSGVSHRDIKPDNTIPVILAAEWARIPEPWLANVHRAEV